MSPSVVELMFAVGATPIGRPSSANYPDAANAIADFGTSYQPNFELIAAMRPDLIIADAIIHKPIVDDLAKLGAPVFAVRVGSFDDVVKGLRVVGALTGNAEAGNREAKGLEDKLAQIKAKQPARGPSVLVVIISPPDQVFAARPESYIGDMITRLGGRNVITTEPENFRLPGFTEYSLERIVEREPDVILAISPAPRGPRTSEILGRSPVWSSLRAVKQGRVLEVDAVVYLQSAGPRVSLILDELSRFFYPDVFKAS
jgi:iron complex transport system substrate-binding protein